ncbi:MAG: glycosyltransferase family 2 protein, partial [Verrucomicrobiota bacterium]
GNRPGALESGFEVTVEMASSNFAILRLEAEDPDGRWREVFRKRISSRPGKGETPADQSYGAWIKRYDTLSSADRVGIRDHIRTFPSQPRFDVMMTLSDPAMGRLEASLKSVRAQLYPNWQLWVVAGKPGSDRAKHVLSRLAKLDRRIHIVSDTRGAEGDFCARLDAGDLLEPTALYLCAHEINQRPDLQLIYSDEDQLDSIGNRVKPHFRPDWNATLFVEQNHISRLTVLRADLANSGELCHDLEELGGRDLIEKVESSRVSHLPWVLYHRHGESIAKRRPQPALLREAPDTPLVSIVIPTRDWVHLLEACVTSILNKTTYPDFEIIIVDNGSRDSAALAYLAAVAREPRVRVLRRDEEFNYSRLNNVAVQSSEAEFVALVNNDIVVSTPEWLDEMVGRAMSPEVGAVGPRLLYPDGRIQQAGVILGAGLHGVAEVAHRGLPRDDPGYFGRAGCAQELSAVGAACMVVRRKVYLEVGGFDEERLKVAFNDIDFCLKLRARGYRIIYTPYAELFHLEHASRGHENTEGKKERFAAEIAYMKEKWGAALHFDPAYNPNLSLCDELFALAFPPRVTKPWRS